jgi:hypothetical protein
MVGDRCSKHKIELRKITDKSFLVIRENEDSIGVISIFSVLRSS